MTSPKPDISNRDFFAALFLQGLLANSNHYDATYENFKREEELKTLRDLAVDQADKLIAQLEASNDQPES